MRWIIPAMRVLGHIYTAVPASLRATSRHPGHPHIFSTSCSSSSSDLAPCLLLKKYRTLEATLHICTITGIARGLIIYIYLLLCNSHVQRERWIYITNNWSSLLLCYTFRVWSLVHTALPALPQCHLHFPRIHYRAAAVCFAFIPQVAPHMKITHHIPWENSLSLNSTLLTISCALTSWLPRCFVWNPSTLGAKSRKSQLPHKWPASLLRWSPLCSSPVLFNCWETGRGLARLEVLFAYLFMVFPFNIHVFFQHYRDTEPNLLPLRWQGPEIRFQLQWAQWMKGGDRWIDREGTREQGFACSVVNGRQALKVTGCVYYWSVSRLMGSREERAETRARWYGIERKPRAISSVIPAPLVLTALRATLVRAELYSAATIFSSIITKIWTCFALWEWWCWNLINR